MSSFELEAALSAAQARNWGLAFAARDNRIAAEQAQSEALVARTVLAARARAIGAWQRHAQTLEAEIAELAAALETATKVNTELRAEVATLRGEAVTAKAREVRAVLVTTEARRAGAEARAAVLEQAVRIAGDPTQVLVAWSDQDGGFLSDAERARILAEIAVEAKYASQG